MSKDILTQEVIDKAKNVKLLLMDCDGVLTDGRLYFSETGEELKVFHVHDGQGIANWHKAGYKTGVITGRKSKALEKRVEELGIHFLFQNSTNKVKDFIEILSELDIEREEVAYIGDDISDKELLSRVNFPIRVKNSISDIKDVAVFTTSKNGGSGAVREVIDLMLKIKSKKQQ